MCVCVIIIIINVNLYSAPYTDTYLTSDALQLAADYYWLIDNVK